MQATKGPRYLEADQPFLGRRLTSLLTRAEAQHELMLLTGRDDTYKVEAVYDIGGDQWTGQLHDAAGGMGSSLYSVN